MNKKYANYTIQTIDREQWIRFRVICAKNGLQASKIFRSYIDEFIRKNK